MPNNKHKIHVGPRRHGKRQVDSSIIPSSVSSAAGIGFSTLSVPSPTQSALPIPPSLTSIHTTLTVIPTVPLTSDTSIIRPTNPLITISSPSSLPSSATSVSITPQLTSLPSVAPASSPLSSTTDPALISSEITSILTTMSDSHPVTVTTVIRPAASLWPDDNSSHSFLDNKAESGAVFAVVGLVVVAGVGFLAYRFHRTVKRRNADRETEEAARAAARIRVRLDDGDDDPYGGGSSTFSPSMTQMRNEPHSIRNGSDWHSGEGTGEYDGVQSSDHPPYLPFPLPLHLPTGSLQMQTALDMYGLPMDEHDVSDSGQSAYTRRSGESGENLLLTRSNTSGGLGASDYVAMPPRSATRPSRSPSTSHSAAPESLTSGQMLSPSVARSQSSRHSERPPLPSLPLPAAFGEGERPSTGKSVFGDDEDYHDPKGRVLKIANE